MHANSRLLIVRRRCFQKNLWTLFTAETQFCTSRISPHCSRSFSIGTNLVVMFSSATIANERRNLLKISNHISNSVDMIYTVCKPTDAKRCWFRRRRCRRSDRSGDCFSLLLCSARNGALVVAQFVEILKAELELTRLNNLLPTSQSLTTSTSLMVGKPS